MEKKQRRYKDYSKVNNVKMPLVEEETVEETVMMDEPVVEVLELKATLKDCSRLNVRQTPNLKSRILHVIDSTSIVTVLPKESTNEWYKTVVRVNGNDIAGYCMKKFISVG